jgi:hypothetical protein
MPEISDELKIEKNKLEQPFPWIVLVEIGAETHGNLLTRSEDFSNASWSKTQCSVTANDAQAPDENTTADKITTSGVAAEITQDYTVSDPEYRTFVFSVFAKSGTLDIESSDFSLKLRRDNNTDEVVLTGDDIPWVRFANGWCLGRVIHTFSSSTSGDNVRVIIAATVTGKTFYLWGAQLEERSIKGVADATLANYLLNAAGGFSKRFIGSRVLNITDNTRSSVIEYITSGKLKLNSDIFTSGEAYCIYYPDDEVGLYVPTTTVAVSTSLYHVSNYVRHIKWNNFCFTPYPVNIGSFKISSRGEVPVVDVEVSNLNKLFKGFMKRNRGLVGQQGNLYLIHKSHLEYAENMMVSECFEIVGSSNSATVAAFQLSLGIDAFGVTGPQGKFSHENCPAMPIVSPHVSMGVI